MPEPSDQRFEATAPVRLGCVCLAVLTSGLLPFIGREIEFMPTALPPHEIAELVFSASTILITRGPVLKDSETIGTKSRSMMQAILKPQGQRRRISVIQLVVQDGQTIADHGKRLPGLGG